VQRPRGRTIGTAIILSLALVAAVSLATGWLGWSPFPHVKAQVSSQNSQSKPGGTIVINPTEAECKEGWRPGLRWTQEQFAEHCAQLQSSK
jgi:hypothetical protein